MTFADGDDDEALIDSVSASQSPSSRHRIHWSAFHKSLEHALSVVELWLEAMTDQSAAQSGLRAVATLRNAWHEERFDEPAYATLENLVSATSEASGVAARSAVEAIGAWRDELEEAS